MAKGGSFFARSWRGLALAGLLGFLLMAAACCVGSAAGPFEADPDYSYLLNGLQLLTLHSPAYRDHPGTPLELIAALTIAVAWLSASPWHGFSSVIDQVLRFPGFYLAAINIVLLSGIVAAAVFFAGRVRSASGTVFPALVGSLTIFLSAAVFVAVHRITPEPLLLAGGMVLAGLVAPQALSSAPPEETKSQAVMMGLVIGFCIATKVTAAPLLVMIFLLRGGTARKIALAACVLTAVALTLPVIGSYREMMVWYIGLFTHRGAYGTGAVGALRASDLAQNTITLVRLMPEVFVCLAVYLAALLARLRGLWRPPPGAVRALAFCLVFVLADLLLVVKQPEPRYTIPMVPFLCLGNAIIARFLLGANVWSRVGLVGIMTALGLSQGFARTQALAVSRGANQAVLRDAEQSGCLLAFYYGANEVKYNLFFGDGWAGYFFRDRLVRLYPDFVYYFDGGFGTFSGDLNQRAAHALFAKQKCVYLIGPPAGSFGTFGLSPASYSLVAQSPGRPADALAVYALKPQWQSAKGN